MRMWPWRGENAEARAKRVAHSYRHLAQQIAGGAYPDPIAALTALDEKWQGYRESAWVVPSQRPLDLTAWLPAGQLAEVLGIDARRLRDWARRGHIRVYEVDGLRRYSVGDVVNYQRLKRAS